MDLWGQNIPTSWPGYGDQWDQILYRDVIVSGDGGEQLSFRMRTDFSPIPSNDSGGTGWFNPDPKAPSHFVLNPVDSLMVWIGIPQETGVYDTNRRWLSEVIAYDTVSQPQKVFSQHGKAPVVGADTLISLTIPDLGGGDEIVRIVFQVKTDREFSDEDYDLNGFDSSDGAAMIDDVLLDAALIGDFEASDAIRPRALINGDGSLTVIDPQSYWIATGKPPASYAHVENVFQLPYDDPCGAIGSPDRICNLDGNVLVFGNHDAPAHTFFKESWVGVESPTIRFDPGNPQGTYEPIVQAGKTRIRVEYDMFTGKMGLEEAVFFTYSSAPKYKGPGHNQRGGKLSPAWSGNLAAPCISFSPDPACVTFNSDSGLDGTIPELDSGIDSLRIGFWMQTRCARFGATICGQTNGSYIDNVRVGFINPSPTAAVDPNFWDLLADTFPFNESVAPGTAGFDTTTALIKQGLNLGSATGGEGVIIGDSLAARSFFGTDTRLDLLFRVLPGPGNYSTKGNMNSSLIERDPARPFWASYIASPNESGQGIGAGTHEKDGVIGRWDPNTWNSARMDSADQGNYSPLVSSARGIPVQDVWVGALHEADRHYATLGIAKNICFLVDPEGAWNDSNTCCSVSSCAAAPFFESYPPAAYPGGTPTTTIEGTKILPDGYFSPGTHIEYIIRRSDASNPLAGVTSFPDTNRADLQDGFTPHFDGQRFMELGVFPDLWKDAAYGGAGLACMMVFDAADRRGQEMSLLGALDSLGYGKNNGAGRGWKEVDPANPNPNDPAGFVAENRGQKGLAFDWFDVQAAESSEGDRPGCRILGDPLTDPATTGPKQCKQGPTPDMLKVYYSTIWWAADDLEDGAIHDGLDSQEQSDEVALLRDYLLSSSFGDERAVWFSGDGIATDLDGSQGDAQTLLNVDLATTFLSDRYRFASGNFEGTMVYDPVGSQFHPERLYGMNNGCLIFPDVIAVNQAVAGGSEASRYEDVSHRGLGLNPGTYTASVLREPDLVSRYFTTLLTAHDPSHLRGVGAANSVNDQGRILFISDALEAFGLCAAIGPVVAVGDLPGAQGARLNFVRGSFPNPSAGPTTVRFSLAQKVGGDIALLQRRRTPRS